MTPEQASEIITSSVATFQANNRKPDEVNIGITVDTLRDNWPPGLGPIQHRDNVGCARVIWPDETGFLDAPWIVDFLPDGRVALGVYDSKNITEIVHHVVHSENVEGVIDGMLVHLTHPDLSKDYW